MFDDNPCFLFILKQAGRMPALCLAIDNEWGAPASRQKAEQLYQDVLCWFYGHTGSFVQPPDGRGVVSLTYCTSTHLCVS